LTNTWGEIAIVNKKKVPYLRQMTEHAYFALGFHDFIFAYEIKYGNYFSV